MVILRLDWVLITYLHLYQNVISETLLQNILNLYIYIHMYDIQCACKKMYVNYCIGRGLVLELVPTPIVTQVYITIK